MKQKIRVRSPFRGGQIITEPTELYGRDKELEYLETALLHTSNHVEVIAERKFGKTSLLRCFMAKVEQEYDEPILIVYADVSQFICSRWQHFYAHLLRLTHLKLLKYFKHIAEAVINELPASYRVMTPPMTFTDSFADELIESKWNYTTDILSRYFAKLAQHGLDVVLLLDELTYATHYFNGDELHFSHLRNLAMSRDKFSVNIAFADRRTQDEIAPERETSPGLNFIHQTLRLGVLSEQNARKLIIENGRKGTVPVEFTEKEIEFILWQSGRLSFLLQLIAEKIYLQKARNKTVDLNRVARQVTEAARSHMLEPWRVSSNEERLVLQTITSGKPVAAILQPTQKRLLSRRLILQNERGELKLYCPIFESFIQDQLALSPPVNSVASLVSAPLRHHEENIYRVLEHLNHLKTRQEVEQWLLNFDNYEERVLAIRLLFHIHYYDLTQTRILCEQLHQRLGRTVGRKIDRRRQVVYVTFGGPAKSGETIARYYRSANHIPADKFISAEQLLRSSPSSVRLQQPARNKTYVILDDFIGSGTQMSKFWNRLDKNWKASNWIYLSLLGYEAGITHISRNTNLKVQTVHKLTERDKVLSPSANIYSQAELSDAKRMLEHYGSQLYREHPLGYENGQGLVVFHDSVPNNTLPIIWSTNNWTPIFRRHGG